MFYKINKLKINNKTHLKNIQITQIYRSHIYRNKKGILKVIFKPKQK